MALAVIVTVLFATLFRLGVSFYMAAVKAQIEEAIAAHTAK